MKKIIFLLAFLLMNSSASAMVRAGVDVDGAGYYSGPYYGYYYQPYQGGWYGPGWYWGNYYYDAPSYYAWRRRYYGGPYYWRYRRAEWRR